MQSKFPTSILAPAILAVAALATIPAVAETTATVKVPFNFTVAGRNLPAGNYSVERDVRGVFVTLQSQQTAQSFVWIASPSSTKTAAASLTFDQEGQNYTLRSVQSGPVVTPRLDRKKASDSERIINSAGQ
ncbi:MAG: hypothetical protein ABSD67_08095 [Terracidiphilus sp.]|jgi:hypothetical protein